MFVNCSRDGNNEWIEKNINKSRTTNEAKQLRINQEKDVGTH